ncbi:FAD-linked oxidase (plasmid) [Salipiger sp. CCB-MM3]|uniref:FAD-binding oxidoreductase n=1 Tax=Salipiger sp. CCB-MM3 TaxID=1792508 RepID=UPI00080AA223|nr:FAD-binding oxidoreductase [Salipiger sp. CCB-MM3]ANT63403.1 FAD-linked oxidase [Salipiger sp. CCB-MM3]
MHPEPLTGWGRFPPRFARVASPRDEAELRASVAGGGRIARGNGRSYGDSSVGSALSLSMRRMNRMLAFDTESGQLVAEAGVLLGDVIDAFLPRGWFPYVTPGTKFVTLGGIIAADAHGKNHHRDGSFGAFVDWIDLLREDGRVVRLSRDDNTELFDWTLGGMGLTGVILRAAIRLRPVETGWIRQRTLVAPNLDAALSSFEAEQDATYSVAWIDCLAKGPSLGRSLLMLGEHAGLDELPEPFGQAPLKVPSRKKRRVPFDAPSAALNRYSVKLFNALYWRKGVRGAGAQLVDWDSYFYPLDAVLGWNRIYGRKGFMQFQCVLPLESSRAGLTALLTETARAGQGSFLAVLKRLGAARGGMSFPMPGYTLALDFPVNRRTLALLDRLDEIALAHGGRFYLAKDARMTAQTLHHADPRAARLREMRRDAGIDRAFASAQSERLLL